MDQESPDLLQVITDLTALLNDVDRARLARCLRVASHAGALDAFTVLSLAASDLDDLATRLLLDHGPMPGARLK